MLGGSFCACAVVLGLVTDVIQNVHLKAGDPHRIHMNTVYCTGRFYSGCARVEQTSLCFSVPQSCSALIIKNGYVTLLIGLLADKAESTTTADAVLLMICYLPVLA